MEGKAFPTNPKPKCRVSQCGEHGFSANKKKNGDYYEYKSFPYFMYKLCL